MSSAQYRPLDADEAYGLALESDIDRLCRRAARVRDRQHGQSVSYSPKVFIPLTRLCRDVCHYCTFAQAPRHAGAPFLEIEEVLRIAREGERAGCTEALFTLGEKPEYRYRVAREWLSARGYPSTVAYLAAAATAVLRNTALLPHINAGTLNSADVQVLRECSASMGIMLESGAATLLAPGGPHHGSVDKQPWRRLATLARAGRLRVPMTSGLLVGIGESRTDRIRDLLNLRRLQQRYGHLQEVIIQNFRAKAGTRMAAHDEPELDELRWTIAAARLVLPGEVALQAPPNLSPHALEKLIGAGINDWGGISPVTPDHVNPEAPWPEIESLREASERSGKRLLARLTIYPRFLRQPRLWLSDAARARALALADSDGLARDCRWYAGATDRGTMPRADSLRSRRTLHGTLDACAAGKTPDPRTLTRLLQARGSDFHAVVRAADELRQAQVGAAVSFVVNRNINYTNVCQYACSFCAFSKRSRPRNGGEAPYDIDGAELARRTLEARERGATEVCLQGGIHPDYTGRTYLSIVETVRRAAPDIHVHAFSPLEVMQGARSIGVSVAEYLTGLREAGLGTLPGTAAEILSDEVRAEICPDKLTSAEWVDVIRTAHRVGLRTTATMMFGHVDTPLHWAQHLLTLLELQRETGGLTEFVPLPFVAREAPMARRGEARWGPTLREAVLVHAVARLVLGHLVPNIQASWVKLGRDRALDCLDAGANDLGGTLMNESITRAAGAAHGQCWSAPELESALARRGRRARIRRTDYSDAPADSVARARADCGTLAEPVNLRAGRVARSKAGPAVAASRGHRGSAAG